MNWFSAQWHKLNYSFCSAFIPNPFKVYLKTNHFIKLWHLCSVASLFTCWCLHALSCGDKGWTEGCAVSTAGLIKSRSLAGSLHGAERASIRLQPARIGPQLIHNNNWLTMHWRWPCSEHQLQSRPIALSNWLRLEQHVEPIFNLGGAGAFSMGIVRNRGGLIFVKQPNCPTASSVSGLTVWQEHGGKILPPSERSECSGLVTGGQLLSVCPQHSFFIL